jgi:hypothetical protein
MRRPVVSLAILLSACSREAPPEPELPPPLPDGVNAGQVVYTTQKENQPATLQSFTSPALFAPECTGDVGMSYPGNNEEPARFIEMTLQSHSLFERDHYRLTSESPISAGEALVSSSHVYPFITPYTPTTGDLTISYVSPDRLDGSFVFRGGADSAGVTWVVAVSGTFSAVPYEPPLPCSP